MTKILYSPVTKGNAVLCRCIQGRHSNSALSELLQPISTSKCIKQKAAYMLYKLTIKSGDIFLHTHVQD